MFITQKKLFFLSCNVDKYFSKFFSKKYLRIFLRQAYLQRDKKMQSEALGYMFPDRVSKTCFLETLKYMDCCY